MATPRITPEEQLRRLAALKSADVSDEMRALVRQALTSKLSYLIARAADLVRNKRLRELIPDLLSTFARLMGDPVRADRGCEAMTAIVRALHELDHDDPAVYLQGIHHIQLDNGRFVDELGIERPADSAIPLRSACAIALARLHHPPILLDLAPLLVDKEHQVRSAAAQAIAAAGRHEGQLLLRLKVLTGDPNPDVIMECLAALLQLTGGESVPFVAGYLAPGEESIREAATLALGASRLPAAFAPLRAQWTGNLDPQYTSVLLTAIAMLRHDEAMDFLISLVRTEAFPAASAAITALKSAKTDPRIRGQVDTAIAGRGDSRLAAVMAREFA